MPRTPFPSPPADSRLRSPPGEWWLLYIMLVAILYGLVALLHQTRPVEGGGVESEGRQSAAATLAWSGSRLAVTTTVQRCGYCDELMPERTSGLQYQTAPGTYVWYCLGCAETFRGQVACLPAEGD